MSSHARLWMERLQYRPRWIRRALAPQACSQRAVGPTSSWPVVVAAVVWLALGLASTVSCAWSTPGIETAQSGNAKAQRAPQKIEETPPPPSVISYTTMLDRTAIWVGDKFRYMITVDYSSEFEFVLDNLNKEDVNMDPFTVVDVVKKTTPLTNQKTRLLLDITLANYSLNQTEARIPQLSLYYFRRDQHTTSAEQAAAESLTVPGPTVGLRSALPPNPADIRDSAVAISWERSRWVVPVVGWAALVFLVIWIGWEAFLFVKKRRTTQGSDRWISMEAVRARWAGGVPSDFSDSQTTAEFLDRSYLNLKEYLSYYLQTATAGLTAEELKEEMQRLGASSDVTQKVAKVLGACEALRYSGDGTAASAESARSVAQDVREILSLTPND